MYLLSPQTNRKWKSSFQRNKSGLNIYSKSNSPISHTVQWDNPWKNSELVIVGKVNPDRVPWGPICSMVSYRCNSLKCWYCVNTKWSRVYSVPTSALVSSLVPHLLQWGERWGEEGREKYIHLILYSVCVLILEMTVCLNVLIYTFFPLAYLLQMFFPLNFINIHWIIISSYNYYLYVVYISFPIFFYFFV